MATPDMPPMTPEFMAESQSGKTITVMWVVTILATVFVGLRVYVRLALKKYFGWDDGIAVAALAFLIAYAAVVTSAAQQGLGRHMAVIVMEDPQKLINIGLLAQISQTTAIMACTLGKTSFAVTLLRIVTQRWIKWILWFIIITMNVVNVLAAIFVFVQCEDPRHLWNQAIPSKCWPTDVFTNFSLFVGGYSGAQDFVLALLPWVVIMKLQMKMKERIAVAFAMSLGIFAGATAIVKTTYLVNLSKRSDFTWALPPLLMWAAAEDGLTLIAASIPMLRPILKAVFPGSSAAHSGYSDMDDHGVKGSGHNPARIFSGKDANRNVARVHAVSSDDISDKSILDKNEHRTWELASIKKTTEVIVAGAVR